MIVMIDVDGVLADFSNGYQRLMHKLSEGATPQRWEPTDRGWEYPYDLFPRKIQSRAWDHIKSSGKFWLELEPLPSKADLEFFKETLQELQADKYFVTARVGSTAKVETEQWLSKHLGFNPTVIVSDRKGEIAAAIGATCSIDDKADNAIAICTLSPKTDSYLLDTIYNKFDHSKVGLKVQRVASLGYFGMILEGYA